MSKRLIHAVVGLLLSGCTINQYGPHITVGEAIQSTVVDVSLDDTTSDAKPSEHIVVGKPPKPATVFLEKPVIKNKSTCIPMPNIPEPPRLDMEILAKHSSDEKQLQGLFEKNHAELFKHAIAVKKTINEWYAKPNHC